jgi:hypothetical protein
MAARFGDAVSPRRRADDVAQVLRNLDIQGGPWKGAWRPTRQKRKAYVRSGVQGQYRDDTPIAYPFALPSLALKALGYSSDGRTARGFRSTF